MGRGRRWLRNAGSGLLLTAGLIAGLGSIGGVGPAEVPPEPPSASGPPRPLPASPSSPAPPWEPASASSPTTPPPPTTPAAGEPPLHLSVPAIGLEAPVVPAGLTTVREGGREWITWEPPAAFAAGWLTTSAYPGQPGNVVLIGHHNIHGKVFADLYRLRPGDLIRLETRRRAYVYRVEALQILPEKGQPLAVRQRNLQWVLPTADERLTLVTCWPPQANTHRLIVVARPAKP